MIWNAWRCIPATWLIIILFLIYYRMVSFFILFLVLLWFKLWWLENVSGFKIECLCNTLGLRHCPFSNVFFLETNFKIFNFFCIKLGKLGKKKWWNMIFEKNKAEIGLGFFNDFWTFSPNRIIRCFLFCI